MLISPKSRYDVDALARNLAVLARQAAAMPPAYMGAGIHEPCIAPRAAIGQSSNGSIGKMLDGKGLLLEGDLKDLGILRPIPHVYERTLTRRLYDKLGDERGAITTYDGIVNARASSNFYDTVWGKASITTVASAWSSMYRAGGFPAAGTYSNIPSGAAKNSSDAGGLMLGFPNPSGGNSAYLATVGMIAGQQVNCFLFVDLLVAAGNILLTTASAQTVTPTALTRYTTGAGVYMTFEVTTAAGGTAQNVTVSYTNQAGTSGQSTGAVALTASAIVQRLEPVGAGLPMALASGDYGVRTLATVTMSGTNTGGPIALNLFKPLAFIPGLVANVYGEKDTTITLDTLVPMPVDGSGNVGCVALYVLPNTTSTGICTPTLRGIWG